VPENTRDGVLAGEPGPLSTTDVHLSTSDVNLSTKKMRERVSPAPKATSPPLELPPRLCQHASDLQASSALLAGV